MIDLYAYSSYYCVAYEGVPYVFYPRAPNVLVGRWRKPLPVKNSLLSVPFHQLLALRWYRQAPNTTVGTYTCSWSVYPYMMVQTAASRPVEIYSIRIAVLVLTRPPLSVFHRRMPPFPYRRICLLDRTRVFYSLAVANCTSRRYPSTGLYPYRSRIGNADGGPSAYLGFAVYLYNCLLVERRGRLIVPPGPV